MAGFFVFSSDDPDTGLTTGTDLAVNVFLDILTDTLYFTDGENIFEWEGGATPKEYTWRSQKSRFSREVNLGAVFVEAKTYADLTFNLYADIDGVMTLKHTQTVLNGEPFRTPGGYLSNVYQVELVGTDVVERVAIAETVFDLVEG